MKQPISRRRFITISAVVATAGLTMGMPATAYPQPMRWRGTAMGATAELILCHPDHRKSEHVLLRIQDEIQRLEKVFSIYDRDSSLSRLNRDGALDAPPLDLVRCLGDAVQISRVTNGAFDASVQPLWNLYARHFAADPAIQHGPSQSDIKEALNLIDYRAIEINPHRISLNKQGMALTLNGIAQGYMTDRIADLLKSAGFDNVLIDLGETRGLGQRENGSDWQVGIKSPDETGELIEKLHLRNQAIATSGGYGTRFSSDGEHHHLFDPITGRSSNLWKSVSVIAVNATHADGFSTAFSSMPEDAVRQIIRDHELSVIAIGNDGAILRFPTSI